MSRSNGESSAARPAKGCPSWAGSTRHCPADALDDRGLPDLAHDDRLERELGALRPGDAHRAEPSLVAQPLRVLRGRDGVVGVDPGGEVPEPVAAATAGGRDLPALDEAVEHHPHVAVVVPAAGGPGHHAGVGQLAHRQRTVGAQPLEDVAPAVVVGPHPLPLGHLPVAQLALPRPLRHLGARQREVLGHQQPLVQLDQALLVDGVPEVLRVEPRAQPAPQHQLGARRDGAGGLELQQREPAHGLDDVGGAVAGQRLGADRDPARVLAAQLVDRAPAPGAPGAHGVSLAARAAPRSVGCSGPPHTGRAPRCASAARLRMAAYAARSATLRSSWGSRSRS